MTLEIPPDKHVLIAGPTASGKSALALMIAKSQGGVIVNADALQVYDGWRIVTARPDDADLAQAPHLLYGHVAYDQPYSVGDWLREVEPLLDKRLIIVGGTGLYFTALTEGLAAIPEIPADVRRRGNDLTLTELLNGIDVETRARIDIHNRARVQRAWEVLTATERSLAKWQDDTPPPLLPLDKAAPILLNAPKDWLTPRIEQRFGMMLDQGALAEAEAMLPNWDPAHPSSKAIGAPELIAHLKGELSLDDARDAAVIATRQYAKRQRTWFRKRMADWHQIDLSSTDLSTAITLL